MLNKQINIGFLNWANIPVPVSHTLWCVRAVVHCRRRRRYPGEWQTAIGPGRKIKPASDRKRRKINNKAHRTRRKSRARRKINIPSVCRKTNKNWILFSFLAVSCAVLVEYCFFFRYRLVFVELRRLCFLLTKPMTTTAFTWLDSLGRFLEGFRLRFLALPLLAGEWRGAGVTVCGSHSNRKQKEGTSCVTRNFDTTTSRNVVRGQWCQCFGLQRSEASFLGRI